MPSAAGELLELVRAGEAAAARAAEDGDREALASRRVAAQQLAGDPEQHVGGLERLDATDEEEQLAVDGQAEAPPGLGPVAGREGRQVDPGRDDGHLGRRGGIQLDELAGLVVGVGDEPVGGLDDLDLADLAARAARAGRPRRGGGS